MKYKTNVKPIKGMIFMGCSFTWGSGLNYYSNVSSNIEQSPYTFKTELLRRSHYKFIKAHRFPRLVASHFGTFELCSWNNGGANDTIVERWKQHFRDGPEQEKVLKWNGDYINYGFEDFDTVFFQFTQWTRSVSFLHNFFPHGDLIWNAKSLFLDLLEKNNLTLEDYISKSKVRDLDLVKNFLRQFEDQNYKIYILTWPSDLFELIEKDSWYKEKLIKFTYNGETYDSIESLMGGESFSKNHELTIRYDYDNFDIPPIDEHPSLKCHRVIADSIINHIQRG